MEYEAIILDLDDTIFQTKSMEVKVFDVFFEHLFLSLRSSFNEATINEIIQDLWIYPWDSVIEKYNIPKQLIYESISVLDNMDLKLNISTYPDYHFIQQLSVPKFLVTTGLTSLQQSKINTLNIRDDFEKIVINDTFLESKTKLDIFKALVIEYDLIPEKTLVIGDNSESEIKAGNAMNMITIQIVREATQKGNNAKFIIHSFDNLKSLLNT